jgi:hypothetical protein
MTEPVKKTIRLGELRLARVPLDVTFGGATVTIEYMPYAMDAAWEEGLDAGYEAAVSQWDVARAVRTALAEIITGWNVTDEHGSARTRRPGPGCR